MDIRIDNAKLVNEGKVFGASLYVSDGYIAAIGSPEST